MAKIESEKSTYVHKMGCVVVKGGSIQSTGYNEVRFCSVGSTNFTEWKESLHAERAALSKMKKEDVAGCSVYIYREYANGKPALAKPCSQCAYMLSELGVKKVFYTIDKEPYYREIRL
jgi:deoxycytidylate deaminase